MSLDEYLNKTKPYLRNIIIDLQNSDTWKIQLAIAIIFTSSKNAEEECVTNSRSDNIKFTSCSDVNEVVHELFEPLRSRYQRNLGTLMKKSDLIFDSVHLMYYTCHNTNFRGDGSYIDSPDWIKKKKATTNAKNKVEKCFQYAVTVMINYGETESHLKRVSNIKPFINKHNWKKINYPSKIDDWKTFEKNNPTTILNILYIKEKKL